MNILNKWKAKSNTAKYIGRGSPLGNPFVLGVHGGRIDVVHMYGQYLRDKILDENLEILEALRSLEVDDDLLCFCAPKSCHGSVIAQYHEELREVKVDGFKDHHSLMGKNTENIDHINVSADSNSELGKELAKICFPILCDDNAESESKSYFSSSLELIETELLNSKYFGTFLKNDLPIISYTKLDNESIHVRCLMSYWLDHQLLMLRIKHSSKVKLVITGSASLTSLESVKKAYSLSRLEAGVIISGGRPGVELIAEELAEELNIPLIRFYPYWNMLGEKTDKYLHKEMREYGNATLYVWDGISKDMIDVVNDAKTNNCDYELLTV